MDYIVKLDERLLLLTINLFLYVSSQRRDCYHLSKTLFQFLDYGDVVIISVNKSGIINLLFKSILSNANNLIIRAIKLFKNIFSQ